MWRDTLTASAPHDHDRSTNVIESLVRKSQRLYSLPAVAMEVVELTSHQQVDVQALRACIENDPALTAKILRVVNSSLFGLSRQVNDLGQAVAHCWGPSRSSC